MKKYTPEERIAKFWSKVDQSGGDAACWLWTGAKFPFGYGSFKWQGRMQGAHRIAWQLLNGAIPDGLEVCHNCPNGDNPACCNPAHLFLGTQADNIHDMFAKGRRKNTVKGERHWKCKLSDIQIADIRHRFANGLDTRKALAKEFGISTVHLSRITHFRSR